MVNDQVQSLINYSATEVDADKAIAKINEIKGIIVSMPKWILDYKGSGISDATASTEKLISANNKLIQSNILLQKEITAQNNAKLSSVKVDNAVIQQIILEEKAERDLAKAKKERKEISSEEVPFTTNLAQLREQENVIQKTGDVVSDLRKEEAEATIAAAEWGREIQANTHSAEDLADANTKLATSGKEVISSQSQSTDELSKLIAARLRLQSSMQSYEKDEKDNLALLKSGVITQKEYKDRLVESSTKVELYRNQLIGLNKEIKSNITTSAGGAYKELASNFSVAQAKAKEMFLTLGASHPITIQAQADANKLGNELKAADASVGQFQRNVGNYSSAITSGAQKAFSALRTLANIIPGIGIGGILLAAVDPLIDLYKYLTRLADVTKIFIRDKKMLNDIFIEGDKLASEEITSLQILYNGTQDVTLSTKERIKAAKFLQETYPETFKNYTTEDILLGKAKKGYDDLTVAILKNAMAQAGKNELIKLSDELLDNNLKRETEREQKQIKLDNISKGYNALGTAKLSNRQKTILGYFKDQVIKDSEDANKELDKSEKDIKHRQDLIIKTIGEANLIDQIVNSKKGKSKSTPEVKESTKENIDFEFEKFKILQTRKIKLLDEESQKQSLSADERLNILQQYTDASAALIDRQNQHDIQADKDKLSSLEANLKKAKGTERNNLLVEISNTKKAIELLEIKSNNTLLELEDTYQKKVTQINKDESDKRIKILAEAKKALADTLATQELAINADKAIGLGALDERLAKGLIKRKDYAKQKDKIEKDSLVLTLYAQRQELEGELKLINLQNAAHPHDQPISTTDTENKIKEKDGQIVSALNKPGIDNKTKKKEEADFISHLYKDLNETIVGLVDAQYEREFALIEKKKQLLNDSSQAEINAINNSTLTQQEKAAEIKRVQDNQAAQNKALAAEERRIKREEAKFNRDAAIAGIAENAAVAEFKLVAQGGEVGLAQGAIIAADAIAQIALIAARPLPSYEVGVDSSPEGWAKVHPGEMRIEPSGEVSMTPNNPETLTYLKRGTQIIKADEVNRMMQNSMMQSTAALFNPQQSDNGQKIDKLTDAVLQVGRAQVNAMSKQRTPSIHFHGHADFMNHIKKSVHE